LGKRERVEIKIIEKLSGFMRAISANSFDEKQLARMTPAGFAAWTSRGKWVLAPHLSLLNFKLLEVAAGRIKRLIVSMPPRHGKSELLSRHFPAWYLGTFPDRRIMLASYEADFAASWGRKSRELLQEFGQELFGIKVSDTSSSNARWDLANTGGGMASVGMGGALTGKGAHVLIIDDPVKGAEQAASAIEREAQWEWFNSTAATRLEPGGSIVVVMTRWHEDDLAGRLLRSAGEGSGEVWEELRLPALAEENDLLGRNEGDALWPERFTREELEKIRDARGAYWWSALYQQRPVPRGGQMFKRSWFEIVDELPVSGLSFVRYWDKAFTEGGGAYTAGVLMAKHSSGIYYIVDVVRGQWESGSRDEMILETARRDAEEFHRVKVWLEQEPGSTGRDSCAVLIKRLAGFIVEADKVTGSKEERADPLASQAQAGNIKIVRASWNAAYLDELTIFPRGKYKDQVDASSGAFNKLALEKVRGALGVIALGAVKGWGF
jgi:predicted phage terminase large subunit-like protein